MEANLSNLPLITNRSFYPLYGVKDRYIVLCGGADSGKSRFASQKLTARTILESVHHRWLVIRKTQPAIRKSAFELMKTTFHQFGVSDFADVILTPMKATLPTFSGTEFLFEGLDDPEKLKSIEGITGVWAEEATEITFDDFMQLDIRLRGQTKTYKQIILSFNPVSGESWIKKLSGFFDPIAGKKIADVTPSDWPKNMRRICMNPESNGEKIYATIHHSTIADNQFVDPHDIEILDSLKDKDINFYNVYRLGNWGVLKGLVYSKWILEKESNWPKAYQQRCFGLDFGFSNNPSALIEIGFTDNDNLWVKEHIYEKKLTNADLAVRCQAVLNGEETPIVADCAEPKSISEMRGYGLKVIPSFKGQDSVRNGIQRNQQYRVHVHPESFNVWKEYQSYKWAEDKDGNALNKPVDYMNHAMDAIRYGVTHLRGKAKAGLIISSEEDYEKQKELDAIKPDPNRPETVDEYVWHKWINDDESFDENDND